MNLCQIPTTDRFSPSIGDTLRIEADLEKGSFLVFFGTIGYVSFEGKVERRILPSLRFIFKPHLSVATISRIFWQSFYGNLCFNQNQSLSGFILLHQNVVPLSDTIN